jgi:c-di-GMP-related signal transduction protein
MQAAAIPAVRHLASEGIYLGRQPILDRHREIIGFELLFRSTQLNYATVTNAVHATATVIGHLMHEFGLQTVLGGYKGFINVDETIIMSDAIELLPKKHVVLEVLETVELSASVLSRIDQLRRMGFSVALDDVVALPDAHETTLKHFDVLKIDIQQVGMAALLPLLRSLKGLPIKLLAEKVDDSSQVEQCLALGFDYFQGYFFSKPEVIAGKRISSAHATIMQLLGLLASDAELEDIEPLLKRDATLTVNLLRLTNSVAIGSKRKIASVSSAVMMLGRRQMQRWLQLLLFASDTQRLVSPLMHTAAMRGRVLELLASAWGDRSLEDRAFMTGTVSLMDALLGVSLPDILGSIPVADDVREALLERTGRLGMLLQLAEALESGNSDAIVRLIPWLRPLGLADVGRAHTEAFAWTNCISA